ncbi:MAG: hypothetical protein HYZ37_14655 [Candidatus Solibacter usitatus]|nr:hypothetical protein [Candidatus Solibacter usitatus]
MLKALAQGESDPVALAALASRASIWLCIRTRSRLSWFLLRVIIRHISCPDNLIRAPSNFGNNLLRRIYSETKDPRPQHSTLPNTSLPGWGCVQAGKNRRRRATKLIRNLRALGYQVQVMAQPSLVTAP